jgi:uncharacterized protein
MSEHDVDPATSATPQHSASTAPVATDRPARYGKQLVAHLTRRAVGAWDDDTDTGWIDFGTGRATLTAVEGTLEMRLAVESGELDRLEDVLARHLVRFGTRDELTVRWTRGEAPA